MTTDAAGETIALDLTWAELDRVVARTAVQVRAAGVPDVVIGILRGGMVPAVMLAHQLGVRCVRGIAATRTTSECPNATKHEQPVLADPVVLGDLAGRDVLVVDDVAGTGRTMRAVAGLIAKQRPSRVRQVVVVVNTANWTDCATDRFDQFDDVGTACAGWVRFPWESR